MSNRKRGRITVQSQPTKETRIIQKVASIPFLVVSIFFVIIGVTQLIPNAGLFGIVWTIMAVCFALIGVMNLAKKNGPAHRVGYDVETDLDRSIVGMMEDVDASSGSARPGDTEARLTELRTLYDRRLITQVEYDEKRKEILERL